MRRRAVVRHHRLGKNQTVPLSEFDHATRKRVHDVVDVLPNDAELLSPNAVRRVGIRRRHDELPARCQNSGRDIEEHAQIVDVLDQFASRSHIEGRMLGDRAQPISQGMDEHVKAA
jgi:hypothetical protein